MTTLIESGAAGVDDGGTAMHLVVDFEIRPKLLTTVKASANRPAKIDDIRLERKKASRSGWPFPMKRAAQTDYWSPPPMLRSRRATRMPMV